MIFFYGRQAAKTRADEHTNPLGILFIYDKSGIFHGIVGGAHCVLDEEIHLFDFFFINEIFGVEALDLTGNLDRHIRSVKSCYQADARLTLDKCIPVGGVAGSEG